MSTTPTAPAILWQVETGLLVACVTQGALEELLHEWLGDRICVRVLDYGGSQFSYLPEPPVSVQPADVEVVRTKLLLLGSTLEGFDARHFGGTRHIPQLFNEYVRLAKPGAAPNGGQATLIDNSSGLKGPQSVNQPLVGIGPMQIQQTTILGVALWLFVSGCEKSQLVSQSLPSKAAATVRYNAKQGNMRLEGQSSIHDWVVEGRVIAGFVEVPSDFPAAPSNPAGPREQKAVVEVSVPVRSLKSIRKAGEPYSEKFDEIMQEKLGEQKQPTIRFRLQKLERVAAENQSSVFNSTGELVVGGLTNTIQFPVTVSKLTGTELRITGVASVEQSDYGILPPLMDPPTNRLVVTVSFDWTVERAKAK